MVVSQKDGSVIMGTSPKSDMEAALADPGLKIVLYLAASN